MKPRIFLFFFLIESCISLDNVLQDSVGCRLGFFMQVARSKIILNRFLEIGSNLSFLLVLGHPFFSQKTIPGLKGQPKDPIWLKQFI